MASAAADDGSVVVREEDDEKAQVDRLFDDASLDGAPANDLLGVMVDFAHTHASNVRSFLNVLAPNVTDTWDPENDVIAMTMEPIDTQELVASVDTQNAQFNKVARVFSVLCSEIAQLADQAEAKFHGPLAMFGQDLFFTGDNGEDDGAAGEGASSADASRNSHEAQMGRAIPLLQDLSNFVTRVHNVVCNLVMQLACLYHDQQQLFKSTFKTVQLTPVIDSLSEALRILVTLDSIVTNNPSLGLCWQPYKRMIKYVRADPPRYGVDEDKLRSFESLLLHVDTVILSSRMFETCVTQDFSPPGSVSGTSLVTANRELHALFIRYLKERIHRTTQLLGQELELLPRTSLVELFSVYALMRQVFDKSAKPDKSMYRSLWELQKKVPVVWLYGQAIWLPADFLLANCSMDVSVSPQTKDVLKTRKDFLRALDESFPQRVEALYQQTCKWMVRMESEFAPAKPTNLSAVLNQRSKLVIHGILLATAVQNLLSVCMTLHECTNTPFISRNIRFIAICAELLKAIEATYHRRSKMLVENMAHMLGQAAFTLRRLYDPILKKIQAQLSKSRKLSDDKLDVLAAVTLGRKQLSLTPTRDRRILTAICLSIAQQKQNLRQNYVEESVYQMWKLNLLADFQRVVRRSCSTSVLFWSISSCAPAFMTDIYDHPSQVTRLQYLFSALRDPAPMIRSAVHLDDNSKLFESYKGHIKHHFTECVLSRLARDVENDLRLHIHSVVLQQSNLRQKNRDLSRFLKLEPLNWFDEVLDIRTFVTHYLDTTFYNLTTVTLHDWQIYAEMRNLSYEKYGLELTEVHLPGHSHYSESLDVLEIMRNIHVFVSRYNYNMNTQTFVERAFNQKHIKSINTEHIASSIRTHGTGIMNTTVNVTFQFLGRKFLTFSEFLFDDHIKSKLMKDIRYFKAEKEALDSRYPYARAEKFNTLIRKLGVTDDGKTYLDQFRRLITEIGNAMGYIRMVRTGGMQHVSNAVKFVPDIKSLPNFEDDVRNSGELNAMDDSDDKKADDGDDGGDGSGGGKRVDLSAETMDTARNLDTVLDDLLRNFAEGTEYFSVLVKVFQDEFRGEKHGHLRHFFIIIPAMTINFVEHMLAQKDTLKKKGGRGEAAFTDDGFALGLAYILKLLEQERRFDSLHWFDSVERHMHQQLQEVQAKLSSKRGHSAEDVQHFELTGKRVRALKREFELLFFSFSGARIFFRDAGPTKPKESTDEKTAADGQADESSVSADASGGGGDADVSASTAAASSSSASAASTTTVVPPAPPAKIPPAPPAKIPPAPPATIPKPPPVASMDVGGVE